VKWDTTEPDVIPMWIADMDFKAADPIIEAINRRAAHGVFAYTQVTDEYYDAVIRWFARRHGWDIRREWIQYTIGVVPALSCII
jgi:cystathionine beta-lyase